jgi:hypothetical protein
VCRVVVGAESLSGAVASRPVGVTVALRSRGAVPAGQIYISGLPPTITDERLVEHFGGIGFIKTDKRKGTPVVRTTPPSSPRRVLLIIAFVVVHTHRPRVQQLITPCLCRCLFLRPSVLWDAPGSLSGVDLSRRQRTAQGRRYRDVRGPTRRVCSSGLVQRQG